jgi:hypothetical protein
MKTINPVDAARIELLLADLRLPAIKLMWIKLAEQSDKEGWPAARFLAALAEHEIADRGRRRIERHLAAARLPVGKTLDSFDFEVVPMVSKAQVMALTAGDSWLEKGANLLLFGPPGGGKSHLAAAIGLALVESGWRVLFMRTSDLVQRLQIARRELALESALAKLRRQTPSPKRSSIPAPERSRGNRRRWECAQGQLPPSWGCRESVTLHSVVSPDLTRFLIIWGAVDHATGECHGQGSAGCRVRFLHRACRRVP